MKGRLVACNCRPRWVKPNGNHIQRWVALSPSIQQAALGATGGSFGPPVLLMF